MGNMVMAYWDCPYCGSKGIRGDTPTCPNCGRGRGDVKFYMKDHQEGDTREENERNDIEYVDDEKAKQINRNPDWYCSFCNTLNNDHAKFCTNCGATREQSESNYFDIQRKKAEAEKQEQSAQITRNSNQKTSRRPLLFLIIIVLALVGLFAFMRGNVTQGDLKVTEMSWQRSITVEQNTLFQESDWSVPSGGEITRTNEEFHHFDTVLSHYESVEVERSREVFDHNETYYTYEDMGNGYYEEIPNERPIYRTEYYTETVQQPVYVQVPRYATKYYYDIYRWVEARNVLSSGNDTDPYWPEIYYAEDERQGKTTEAYLFSVEPNSDKSSSVAATYSINEADWHNLHVGDNVNITARRNGSDAYLSDKDGNKIADLVLVK